MVSLFVCDKIMIQGHNLQHQRQQTFPRKLHVGLLEGINLNNYPANRTHYLAYALQFGLKPPSVKTMNRCEARNQKKSGAQKAQKVIGRMISVPRRLKFNVPDKFGPKPDRASELLIRRMERPKRGALRVKYDKTPVYRKGRVYPPRPTISLPNQIQRHNRPSKAKKVRKTVFVIRSPELVMLKAERTKFKQVIEQYRKTYKAPESTIPEYFRKKKASQKRRRKQKHQLIKNNRKALQDIFGDAIFRRGWPVSIKQIKLALGLKEEQHDQQTFLNQFMQMVGKSKSKDKSTGIHMPKAPGETSRMLRISRPQQPEKVSVKVRAGFTKDLRPPRQQFNVRDQDFPSLISPFASGPSRGHKKR